MSLLHHESGERLGPRASKGSVRLIPFGRQEDTARLGSLRGGFTPDSCNPLLSSRVLVVREVMLQYFEAGRYNLAQNTTRASRCFMAFRRAP